MISVCRVYPATQSRASLLRLMGLLILIAVFAGGCAVHPKVINKGEAIDQSTADMGVISAEQQLPDGPVSLYDAMAWAVRYNRERRVRILESALAEQQFNLSRFDMLPDLMARAGYTGRDPESASYSESIQTGSVSLEPSTSQDKARATADATFTWNLLDFGVSYIRANQQADRHLIALEKERKAVQILLRDVRKTWWETLSAQRLMKRIDPLAEKVRRALAHSRQIEAARLQKPMEALGYQRSMLQVLRTLQSLRQELAGAKAELATLMGLPGPIDLEIKDPGTDLEVPRVQWDSEAMEQAALVMRPEIAQARYQGSISRRDVHAAMLGVLPGLKLDAGLNWDANSYLMDASWVTYGTQINWNLFNVFRGPQALDAARAKEDVVREQRLAMSMAVLMQVHLAVANHMEASQLFGLSNEYFTVQDRILGQIRARAEAIEGEQILIREELNQLVAEIRRDKAYAELQDSFGRLLVSMGIDPIPMNADLTDLSALAQGIEDTVTAWQQRDLRQYLGLPAAAEAMRPPVVPLADLVPAHEVMTVTAASEAPPMHQPEPVPAVQAVPEPEPEPEVAALLPDPPADIPSPPAVSEPDRATEAESPGQSRPRIGHPENPLKLAMAPPFSGRTTFSRLHLRNAPSLEAPILAKAFQKGQAVTVLGQTGDWLHVDYQGHKGYMFGRYIQTEGGRPALTPVRIEALTVSDRLHLRNGPSLDADIIGKAGEKGETVWVLGQKGDWFHVIYKDSEGFMSAPEIALVAER